MPWKIGVDIVEKRSARRRRLGFRNRKRGIELGAQLVRNGPAEDGVQRTLRLERTRQASDRVARAPFTDLGLAAIQRGVVTGRVGTHAIGHTLQKRWA